MSDAFNAPYGNAPRELNPQWPNVNLYGQQLVQPQPNPYFAHWPQQMGQEDNEVAQAATTARTVMYGVAAVVFVTVALVAWRTAK